MRKLTALSVALTLFTAGQAFAGEMHAPHVAIPHPVPGGIKAIIVNLHEQGKAANEKAAAEIKTTINAAFPTVSAANHGEIKAVIEDAEVSAAEKIGDAMRTEAEKNDPKKIDAMKTAEKVEAEKDRIVNTVDNAKTADAPNSGGQSAAGK